MQMPVPSDPPTDAPGAATHRQAIDGAIDTAIIILDRGGRVSEWSRGAERLLGWTEAEMRGSTLVRLFPEGSDDLLPREMDEARRTGRGGHEGWRLHKDGRRLWASGETSPLRDDTGALVGYVKILRDRTRQQQAAEALREQARVLEILNRTASTLASETDLDTLVQAVTDAGVALTGAAFGAFFYNVENAAGESYMLYTLSGAPREAFADFPMPRNTAVFAPTFAGSGIVRSDDITRDPRYGRNAPYAGMPSGHLQVVSYLAVPVVSRSGETIGGLFFGHPQPGMFDERSEQRLSGLASEAAIAIDNARLFAALQRELDERRRAEDALRHLNATLEQQVAERTEQLRQNADALRQAQKMEAVGQLTGGVAHDFNNLLQVIVANIDVLRRQLPAEAERLRRAADNAMHGAKRAASLTQRLLAFSRRAPLDPRPVDVNRLVDGMLELLHRTLGETVTIATAPQSGLWPVEADPSELEHALVNLAVNARDAMPEGGQLRIATLNTVVDDAAARRAGDLPTGDYVAIAVADSGCGMDEATLGRVFEPFFTTKPVGQGTGLGLSQVYGFVKQSGGHVGIESAPGRGTTVRLLLPRLKGDAVPIPPPAADPGPPAHAGRGETVLVLEDDDDVRRTSVELLVALGYRVAEASDGPAALALLADPAQPADLLFTDVVLPGGMTGDEVARRAREARPRLKVLFTSGYPRDAIHQGRLDRGLQLIAKPYRLDDLAARLREVLDA